MKIYGGNTVNTNFRAPIEMRKKIYYVQKKYCFRSESECLRELVRCGLMYYGAFDYDKNTPRLEKGLQL